MSTRFIYYLLGFYLLSIYSCDKICSSDEFGDDLELIIPVTTFPSRDIFHVGDTLWVEANIDKEVEVVGHSNTIYLDSFNFFSTLAISEISDTIEYSFGMSSIIVEKGRLDTLPLHGVVAYPIFYEETASNYLFRSGIILESPGIYYIGIYSPTDIFESYDHPVMYKCGERRRSNVSCTYINHSSSEQAYRELMYERSGVWYLTNKYDYEGYRKIGVHIFEVLE